MLKIISPPFQIQPQVPSLELDDVKQKGHCALGYRKDLDECIIPFPHKDGTLQNKFLHISHNFLRSLEVETEEHHIYHKDRKEVSICES